MLSVKLKFRPSTIEGKEGSLFYQLIYLRKVRQIGCKFKIMSDEWDYELEEIVDVASTSPRYCYLNHVKTQIEYDKKHFQCIMSKLSASGTVFSIDTIVCEFQNKHVYVTLFSYMENIISRLWRQGQYRTSETYKATLNSFKKFRRGEDLYIEEIDSEVLMSYECYLRTKDLSNNTISFYMKHLRAVYNNAIEDGYIDNKNPFKKVYTSSEKTIKRAIPLNYIRKLKNMDLSSFSSKCFARDMFLFSFYTRGMSFIDMAYLQKKNLKNGILTYRRKKTGQSLSIRWEICMQEIVEQYSFSNSFFLLPIIKDPDANVRKQYYNTLALINRNLKEIGNELGLSLPLTMYVARHSWASIARSEGVPISVISEGMGHDSEITTQIYLATLETSVIDKANKKILELL
ncbi:MAG: site-specific integrase [Bacteroidales bacterium]|nr:site-specific integrase [Bacteroidales bacterium]